MWVRSQDKGILLNAKDVCICKVDLKNERLFEIISYGNRGYAYTLGEFKTKEKVLEVLNELHQRLDDELEMNLGVFQIPQDDEVEENE